MNELSVFFSVGRMFPKPRSSYIKSMWVWHTVSSHFRAILHPRQMEVLRCPSKNDQLLTVLVSQPCTLTKLVYVTHMTVPLTKSYSHQRVGNFQNKSGLKKKKWKFIVVYLHLIETHQIHVYLISIKQMCAYINVE